MIKHDFELLNDGEFSLLLQESGIVSYNDACRFIRDIRYDRISDPKDISLVFHERQGTCSTKHAFLKRVAEEQGVLDVELMIGVFKMGPNSLPELASIFEDYTFDYIPEAHVYLKIKDETLDFTFKNSSDFVPFLIQEQQASIEYVLNEKVRYHKNFINHWNKTNLTNDEVWELRERCIQQLFS